MTHVRCPLSWGTPSVKVRAHHSSDCAERLASGNTRGADCPGRAMKGRIYIGEEGVAEDHDLSTWVERGYSYAASLPEMKAKKKKKKRALKLDSTKSI